MEQKRKFKRLPTNLKAEYFLQGSTPDGKQCTVINISLNGAGLEFYAHESVEVGTNLLVKIFDQDGEKAFDAEGIVRWSKQGEKDFVCGIELTRALDKFILSTLGV